MPRRSQNIAVPGPGFGLRRPSCDIGLLLPASETLRCFTQGNSSLLANRSPNGSEEKSFRHTEAGGTLYFSFTSASGCWQCGPRPPLAPRFRRTPGQLGRQIVSQRGWIRAPFRKGPVHRTCVQANLRIKLQGSSQECSKLSAPHKRGLSCTHTGLIPVAVA